MKKIILVFYLVAVLPVKLFAGGTGFGVEIQKIEHLDNKTYSILLKVKEYDTLHSSYIENCKNINLIIKYNTYKYYREKILGRNYQNKLEFQKDINNLIKADKNQVFVLYLMGSKPFEKIGQCSYQADGILFMNKGIYPIVY